MQNCNTTPFLLTSEGNPDPKRYPKYMIQEGDNPRGAISRQILSSTPTFTFDEWRRAAFDTRIMSAATLLPQWLESLALHFKTSTNSSSGDARLRQANDELARWDRRSSITSIGMTLFSLWHARVSQTRGPDSATAQDQVAALSDVVKDLEREFGTWRVPWGEVNRLQRLDESKNEKFQDERASFAVPGANGNDGAVFTIYARPEQGQKRRYSVAGSSYVSVVEFGPKVRALSIHTFGASSHPENRHYIDQAALYSRGEFKPAWLTLRDIRANMEAEYRPGEESRQGVNTQ